MAGAGGRHGRHGGAEALAEPGVEGGVELRRREPQRRGHDLGRGAAAGVAGEHGADGVEAPALIDQREHLRGEVVGVDDLLGVARAHEGLAQRAHRRQPPVAVGHEEAGARVVAPARARRVLLVHGEPLGEPARHPVPGHAQVEGVGDLVPQRRAPVELPRRARRRRVEGHHRAEGHAQQADAGEAHGAHGEVGVVGIELDADRRRRRVAVALAQARVGRLGDVEHVGRQHRRLVAVQHRLEGAAAHALVLAQGVEQVEGVLDPHVERVAGEGALEARAPAGHVAQAQAVEPEQAVAAPGARVERQRLLGEAHRLAVEAVLHRHLGEGVVELGVARVHREAARHRGREGRLVAAQEVGRGERHQGLERLGVDLQRARRRRGGLVVALGLEQQPRPQGARRHQIGVEPQRVLERRHGLGGVVEVLAARHRHQDRRVVGAPRQRGPEHLQRLGVVVLGEQQLAEGDARVEVAGVGDDGLAVDAHRVVKEPRLAHGELLGGARHRGKLRRALRAALVVGRHQAAERRRGGVVLAAMAVQPRERELRRQRGAVRRGQRAAVGVLGLLEFADGEQGLADGVPQRPVAGVGGERAAAAVGGGVVVAARDQRGELGGARRRRRALLGRGGGRQDQRQRGGRGPCPARAHGSPPPPSRARCVSASSTSSASRRSA